MVQQPLINVFECASFVSSNDQQKAARASLFGPKTALHPGGWSFYNEQLIENAVVAPANVANLEIAERYSQKFMQDANALFKSKQGQGALFPLDTQHFRLRVVEQLLYVKEEQKPLAWRITWHIDADAGAHANLPQTEETWVPISGAHITLVIEVSGRVICGDASWRPITKTIAANQLLDDATMLADIMASRSKDAALEAQSADTTHAHEEPGNHADYNSQAYILAIYANSSPSQYRNFIEPRLIFVEGHAHSHAPRLEVPVTDYGINAVLIKSQESTQGDGAVLLQPWVINAAGIIDVSSDTEFVTSHWTVRKFGDYEKGRIKKYPTGSPLKLSGLYEVSFTVITKNGAIAHAHEVVCSTPDKTRQRALV